jgi:hypothetical protein
MMKSMLRIMACGAIALLVTRARADDGVGVAEAIGAAVEYPLPPLSEVIGEHIPAAPETLVVIGDANDDQTGCEAKALGGAIGVSLRVHAWGLASNIAFSQPLSFWEDTRNGSETNKLRPGERVARRTGASYWLRSIATQENSGLHLRFELVDIASGDARKVSDRVISGAFAPTLADMLTDVLTPLAFSTSGGEEARLQAWRREPDTVFRDLRAALSSNCAGAQYAAEIERVALEHPESPVLTALHLSAIADAQGAKAVVPVLAAIPAGTAAHPVVRALIAIQHVQADDHHHNAEAIDTLKELAAAYPQEPWIWEALGDALASETIIYPSNAAKGQADLASGPIANHPPYAQAITVALAETARWPSNYRAWWNLAFALGQYADAVRGGLFPGEMSEEAARRYPKLMQVAGKATSRALDANSTQPQLYAMRIDSEVLTGEDWYSTFSQAIALAPHSRMLYDKAMYYARKNWGGNASLRARIYRLARDNNPQTDWPAQIYHRYAGLESYLTIYVGWLWLTALLVVGVAAALWLRRRRQQLAVPLPASYDEDR